MQGDQRFLDDTKPIQNFCRIDFDLPQHMEEDVDDYKCFYNQIPIVQTPAGLTQSLDLSESQSEWNDDDTGYSTDSTDPKTVTAPTMLNILPRPDSLGLVKLGPKQKRGIIPKPIYVSTPSDIPGTSRIRTPLAVAVASPVLKTPIGKALASTPLPPKTQLIAKPNAICAQRSVALLRFKRSRTRKFFHPYAQEIGAIQALKEVASSPDEVAAKFASEALTVIGEELPYKLAQQVPCWTTADVQYWVRKIGFEQYADFFRENMVDGDLLLHLSERDLEMDLKIQSGILRKRFMRELESLKIAADYSSVDDSQLDQFLMSLSPELSVYTYQMLSSGISRPLLPNLTEEMMQNACGITNPIHRLKLKNAFQNAKHIDDIEIAILRQQIDVFISYRRSTGNQLASLIKVLLQLRGYKVFIDVDKLYAGKFDSSLLKNIQAAKHFILVLTPHSLDRLLNDHNCEDWIHKELRCALDHQKNIIPVFDQHFEFPTNDSEIPSDIRMITKYNGVRWVHDYQEACMDKVEKFIKGELNRQPSINQPLTTATTTARKPTRWNSGAVRQPSTGSHRSLARLDAPPTPSFGGSIEKQRRKAYHTSVSTVNGTH
ncbi:unnamed protein product, partial [Mesorhabditis belari]|uniref:ADP-ribosyl cyclase/cyclic ADP-ribose hydrolase n=1 Tax=Mesorhabditis belari TaxID=2138241 RepID=A0AAF3EAF0_9BILA